VCILCIYIYIYGVYDYYYYYHYYKRQEYIIFQNEISESKTYYYLLYNIILAIYDCRREKRRDSMYLLHITYRTYITRVLRHTLRMRRGKRYDNSNSCRRARSISGARRRSATAMEYYFIVGFSDKYFVCVTRVLRCGGNTVVWR